MRQKPSSVDGCGIVVEIHARQRNIPTTKRILDR